LEFIVRYEKFLTLAVLSCIAGGMGVVLWLLVSAPSTWGCEFEPAAPDLPHSLDFIGTGIASFALGNWLGHIRYRGESETKAAHDAVQVWLFNFVLTAMFVAIAGILLYEAFGTWMVDALRHKSDYWPITWYVRCATDKAFVWTLVGSTLISFLFGHWLHRRPPRSSTTGGDVR